MNEHMVKNAVRLHRELVMPPYNEIVNMDGLDALFELGREFGGTSVYVPKLRTIFSQCIEKEILRLYNGRNIHELAHSFDYSERHIRKLIQQRPK